MELIVWRHPKPMGVHGRCVGQTNAPVDHRKAKRLAHRIRQYARRKRLFEQQRPVVWTSPLRRCFDVGRVLRDWGWVQHVDVRLSEMSFGSWDGQPWAEINKADIDAWCDRFADAHPGGGESVHQLLTRCGDFVAERCSQSICLVVGHAGWISALDWGSSQSGKRPSAANWPPSVTYGYRKNWTLA
jgi:alpha-ribazole phosphatase